MTRQLRRFVLLTLVVCGVTTGAFADRTRRWKQSTYEEFLKGTAKGIAVRSDGHLELAPKFTLLADADASYLWSLRTDGTGNLYAGGGSPAKVFKVDANGKPKTVFESSDLLAQCIAFDSKGTLYVGTSPDGKVYKVSASGEKSVFFEPKTKYIWDLAFGKDGTLYVATGDKGQIFAVSPDGKGELYYASDEAHIKVLTFDGKGNLLAGTEPNGRVLRLARIDEKTPRKQNARGSADGFVVYETAKREVTSLVSGTDGTLYVAAIGEKPRGGITPQTTISVTPQGTTTVTNIQPQGPAAVTAPFVAFPQAISSNIYRISAEGVPEELWSSRDEVVYALGLNADGRLLAGTGNTGSLLVIDGRGVYAHLAKSGTSQITGISRASGGKVYLCTANPGKVFSLGPEYEPEGTFESQSFDAKLYSQWGRIEWWGAPVTNGGKDTKDPRLEFYVRSGNTEDPAKEWSRWFGPYTSPDTPVEAPAARFLQWKAVIHDGRPGDGIDWVNVAYLPKNVAPVIDGIAVQEPGVRAQAPPMGMPGQPGNVPLRQPPSANPTAGGPAGIPTNPTPPRFEVQAQGIPQKGYQSALWSAHDDNDDELKFAVYFRGEDQKDWLLLKDNLEQRFYSWDTTTMPDGAYYLKIVATDAPSNPPAEALTAERESERFEVDNTPPAISKLEASATGMNADRSQGVSYDVQFTASHATSSIERAQYSLDGGEWILVVPNKGISDYRTESYSFTVRGLKRGEHTIAVRAYDRFENVGSAKTTIEVK